MMQIKITRTCGTTIGTFSPGDIVRVPDGLAKDLVEVHKSAEYIQKTADVSLPGPAEYHEENVEKPKRGRKPKDNG